MVGRKNILGEKRSYIKKILCLLLVWGGSYVWAGDIASYVDLGFSQDGKFYMFAQYGVQAKTLKPWADLFIVDVPNNNFVNGGKVSFIHDSPVIAGQDGSGAFYRILTRNAALADRYGVSYLYQGQTIYISVEGNPSALTGDSIEFRDFASGVYYRASLIPTLEGSGANVKSSFYITLERRGLDGVTKSYIIGTPQVKRPLINGYGIKKVMLAPKDGSIIFVIETRKQGDDGGTDIRYMVEALRL